MPAFLLSALGGIGSAIGSIASVLGSVISVIGNVLQTAAKLVMSAVQTISNGVMAIGGMLLKGAMAFASVLMKATQAAMAYAKSVNDLRLSTGMSMKEAGDTSLKFQGFGITPQMLAQGRGNEHHSLSKQLAASQGIDLNDPLSINRATRNLPDTPMGHAMREMRLESAGLNTDKGRWLASLSQEQVQGQMDFAQKTSASLGLSPDTISKLAEELPLAQGKLETFLQLVQLKFVETALPMMEKGIEYLSNFITERGPDIANTFSQVFGWIFNEGPSWALQAAETLLGVFESLSNGFFNIADTVLEFLKTLDSTDQGLGLWIGGFLGVVKTMFDVGKFIAEILMTINQLFWNHCKMIANAILMVIKIGAGLIAMAPAALLSRFNIDKGQMGRLRDMELYEYEWTMPGQHIKYQMPDWQKMWQDRQKTNPVTPNITDLQKNLTEQREKNQTRITTVRKSLDDFEQKNGKTDINSKTQEDMLGELKGIRKAAEKTADNSGGEATTTGTQDWLARFAVERARQRYLMETR